MYHDIGVNNYHDARVIQGAPAQAQVEVIAPQVPVCNILPPWKIPISICLSLQEIQGYDIFGDVAQHPPAGIAPDGHNTWPHEDPVPGESATGILRQLAGRYLDHPDSQVDAVHVEPSPAGGIRVIIALEIQVGALP